MGILHRLVVATACPGTHHRLAMDALLLLRCPDADGWRDLFLNYYEPYLRGAKEPDTKFRDFQNHVLHVRENGWGGAIRTSQLWYERLVMALRRQYWSEAVHTAGILGHYLSDPMMPLHTAQSEEEGRVHRAIEWSVANSYDELRNILVTDQGGFPSLPLHDGPDWLARLVRQGAELANSHYETLLDHYNLERGVADPPLGLDKECKDRLAQMIGFSAAAIARVLERAFIEAGTCPPMCELVVETVLATVKAPMRWVARRYDEENEQDLLEEILDEVRRTGKAVESLPDDEKLVRKLHAQQVLRITMRELDSLPAKPTGARHGQGAPERDRETGWLARALQWEIPVIGWLFADDRPAMAPVGMNALASRVGTPRLSASGSRSAGTGRFATIRRPAMSAGGSGSVESPSGRRSTAGRYGGSRAARNSRFGRGSQSRTATGDSSGDTSSTLRDDFRDDPRGDSRDNLQSNSRSDSRSDLRDDPRSDHAREPSTGSLSDSWEDSSSQPSNTRRSKTSDSATAETETGATGQHNQGRFAIRTRMSQAIRGVANRVWQGAATTANKVKAAVPKLRRRQPTSSNTAEAVGPQNDRDDNTRSDTQRASPVASGGSVVRANQPKAPAPAPPSASASGPTKSDARASELRFHLEPDSEIVDAPSIGQKLARRLEALNVKTVGELLRADPAKLAARMGGKQFSAEMVERWQQQAELMCRVPELRGHDAQILVASGVTDPKDLASVDPASLFEMIEPFLATREAEEILRGGSRPDLDEVADWIDWAQHARPLPA
ncbi:MAG: DUF4332 domain-containing protein [Planctomycetota bacterium]